MKSLLPPSAAEYSFETDVFFMILRSKIMKNTSVSNSNLARSAKKKLFAQPCFYHTYGYNIAEFIH